MPAFRVRDVRNVAIIVLCWIAAAILVNPIGEFAVSDDWAYRQSVRMFVDRGEIVVSGWFAANLMSHLAWGAVFGSVFGTSATALRISSLVAALAAGLALYRLMRLNRCEPGIALLGTLMLLFNPLFFILSFSFMSDVSYTAMQTIALWLIAAGMLKPSALTRAGGWFFAVAAMLCRQTGLAVPLGVGAERVLRARFSIGSIIRAIIPVLVFLALQIAYQHWFAATVQQPALYGTQVNRVRDTLLHRPVFLAAKMVEMLVYQFFYLGLFALPLSVALTPHWTRVWSPNLRRVAATIGVVASIVIAAVVMRWWRPFPMWADTMMLRAYGPDLLVAPPPLWVTFFVTALAAGGGLLLCLGIAQVARQARSLWHERTFRITSLVLLVGIAYDAAVMLVIDGFDRYLIPLLPCLFLVLASSAVGALPRARALRISGTVAAFLAFVSICGTHDLMATKRAQLAAYQTVLRSVPAPHVNAGWAMAGLDGFARYGVRDVCCWYDREDYIVLPADTPKAGFRVIARYPVARWLPWEWGRYPVLVQQRIVR